MIHSTAIIDPTAKLDEDIEVGPYSIIGADVTIKSGTKVHAHVVIKGPTTIGHNNEIYQFSSVGEDTQDKKFHGERSTLEIGDDNVIRECATIHRGTENGGGVTRIGNANLLMCYSHVAHDCIVGNNVILSNYAALAGHVIVDDFVTFAGYAASHQFCHIGAHSFIGKGTLVGKDVLPFLLIAGAEGRACGLNTIGLKRRGFSDETLSKLKQSYRIIFRSGNTAAEAIEHLEPLASECSEVQAMMTVLRDSTRGIVR